MSLLNARSLIHLSLPAHNNPGHLTQTSNPRHRKRKGLAAQLPAKYTMIETVTVIIPTTCEKRREAQLLRAIDSIQRQKGASAQVMLVVNGDRFDPTLYQQLRNRSDIITEYLSIGSLPKALEYGRSKIVTDYFGFLDDDDELLETAVATRLQALSSDPSLDVAVTNGYNVHNGQRNIRVQHCDNINTNPLLALTRENWLASCGGLFRTRTVTPDYFHDLMKYYEWTLLAFRITRDRKVTFINEPTYAVNDTPNSLSKTAEFIYTDEKVVSEMLSHPLPAEIKKELSKKLGRSLHAISCYERSNGHYRSAWRYHLRSLLCTGGLVYLLYTRKLILPQLYP